MDITAALPTVLQECEPGRVRVSSQNVILSLTAAVDDLDELLARAETELDAESLRSFLHHMKTLQAQLQELTRTAQRCVQHFERARRLRQPPPPEHHRAEVVPIARALALRRRS